jgi:hypothetical protein
MKPCGGIQSPERRLRYPHAARHTAALEQVRARLCDVTGCTRRSRSRGWCKMHYERWRRGYELGDAALRVNVPAIERFVTKIEVTGDGCWSWTGARSAGYGSFNPGGQRPVKAYRWSYEYFVGPIPDGLVLDHLCCNPPCVNPDHLEPVTSGENVRRAAAQRRAAA